MRYLSRRLLFYLVALWASITLNFAIPRLMPGNPAEVFLASHYQQFQGDPNALRTVEAILGVSNDPLPLQYWHYLVDLAHGDLGISTSFYPARVSTVIAQSLPWTIFLVGLASIIAFISGTGLGIVTAWRRRGLLDTVLPPLTLLASSFPYFFLALLMLYFLGFTLNWFPTSHAYTIGSVPSFTADFIGDVLYHAILPAATIVIVAIGGWLLGMRNTMVNILAEDYINMAQARGLTERRVMLAYAARNAILPQITAFAMALGFLVGGQVLVEYVFSYPGLGYTLANAVGNEDYPLVQALLLIITVAVLAANLVADLVYARLDPRVRSA
ncbi:MAG TPA: ABC transporter permease [Chloroflexota bacterium]|nr:ABC transporter permease [Chloroflexota bacterium]